MKRQHIPRVILIGIGLILSCAVAWGQATTGTILGNVKDASGGAIPGVGVQATNTETNFSRSTMSDETGHFVIQYLPVGTYRLEVELVGFKKFVQTGIVVGIDRNARIDPVLEVGEVTQSVEVTSDAPLVDTAKTVLGQTVSNAEILNLPLVNRNVYDLLNITAGVQNNSSSNSFGPPGQEVSIYGSPNAGTGGVNYTLDGGTSIQSLRNTGNPAPNPDAVEEFRITTHMFDAEYGRYGGGTVNVITKSGTNSFHGSLFDYARNDAFNAQEWNTLQKPRQRRNQFGGSVGGPVKHDKLFFFFSYSGLREREVAVSNGARVPTALERTGDFSQTPGVTLRDPLTGKPFTDNKIPAERLDPTAQNILEEVPLPNLPGNFYEAQVPSAPKNDDVTARIDHTLSEKHQLFGSYFLNKGDRKDVLTGNLPWTERILSWRQQNFNVNESWTVTPLSMNMFHVSYVRHLGGRLNTPALSLADFGSKYAIQGEPALPNINVRNYFRLGTAIDGPRAGSDYYQIRDTFSTIRGLHSLRFGFEGSLDKTYQNTNLNNYGSFDFRTDNTKNELGDFLLGRPRSFNQDAPVYKTDNGWYTGFFVQDEFRVHPRVLLTLGLRYEIQFPLTDPQNRKNTFIPGVQSVVVPTAPLGMLFPGDPGMGSRSLIPIDKNNWAPRLGIVWDPFGDGKTAVRAGAGVYYGSMGGNMANGTADRPPFTIRQQFTKVKSLTDPYGNLPGGVSPFPYYYTPENPRFPLPVSMKGQSPAFVWPYTYQFNFSLQRQVISDLSVTAAYIGSLTHQMPMNLDLNYPVFGPGATTGNVDSRRPYHDFQDIDMLMSGANAAYHGLELAADKRMSRNFSFKAHYTFGKALDSYNMTEGTRGYPQNSTAPQNDRGRSNNDRTHRFVLAAIWDIDYLRSANPVLRTVLNGWTVSGVTSLFSGEPLTIEAGDDINLDNDDTDRADLVGSPRLDPNRPRDQVLAAWFNTAAFAEPVTGADGNAGRNILDGPGLKLVNLGLFRDFRIREEMTLQFRAEATNAFNIVNLSDPETSLSSSTFGRIRSARAMREVQLGLRLAF
jgi:hypothetical protein